MRRTPTCWCARPKAWLRVRFSIHKDRVAARCMRSFGMFRKTDRQESLWGPDAHLPDSTRDRLRRSWAEGFHRKVFDLLLEAEEQFADLYCADNGCPNWSVARKLGVSLLQELTNLSDQDALDCLAFDVRWQHALRLNAEDAYLSRRSLVDFRSRLVAVDPEMKRLRALFDRIVETALADLKLDTSEQRVDSTQVYSNIRTRGRVDLFSKTLRHFLTRLEKEHPEWLEQLSPDLVAWFRREPEGWFGDGNKKENRAKLDTLAKWLYQVTAAFAKNEVIKSDERYQVVVRLFNEQCEAVPEPFESPNDNDDQCEHGPDDDDVEEGSDDSDRGVARRDEESESND